MALEKLGAFWKGKPGSKAVLSGKLEDGRRILAESPRVHVPPVEVGNWGRS